MRDVARARFGTIDPQSLEAVAKEAASLEILELGLGHGVEVDPWSFSRPATTDEPPRRNLLIFARNFKSHGSHLVDQRWSTASGPSALRCVLCGLGSDRRLRLGVESEIVLPPAAEWSDVMREAMIQDVVFYLCAGASPVDPVPEAKLGGVAGFVVNMVSGIAVEFVTHFLFLGFLVLIIWAGARLF